MYQIYWLFIFLAQQNYYVTGFEELKTKANSTQTS